MSLSTSIFGGIIIGVMVAFLTVITESIEFTFLFLVPWLYWDFHAVMTGIGYMFCNIFKVHVAFSFSSGLVGYYIYGIISDVVGSGANCYILLLISLCYVPIYYFVFYWSIKKFNIQTPGQGINARLYSEEDYLAQKIKIVMIKLKI